LYISWERKRNNTKQRDSKRQEQKTNDRLSPPFSLSIALSLLEEMVEFEALRQGLIFFVCYFFLILLSFFFLSTTIFFSFFHIKNCSHLQRDHRHLFENEPNWYQSGHLSFCLYIWAFQHTYHIAMNSSSQTMSNIFFRWWVRGWDERALQGMLARPWKWKMANDFFWFVFHATLQMIILPSSFLKRKLFYHCGVVISLYWQITPSGVPYESLTPIDLVLVFISSLNFLFTVVLSCFISIVCPLSTIRLTPILPFHSSVRQ
jgi:hypothetical protein